MSISSIILSGSLNQRKERVEWLKNDKNIILSEQGKANRLEYIAKLEAEIKDLEYSLLILNAKL